MNQRVFSNQIEHVLGQIPAEQTAYFRNYFINAPDTVLGTLRLEQRGSDRILAEENEPIEQIYILMEGGVRAIDYRVKGSAYEYARFEGITILGSMECVFGIQNYMTTLVTASPCTFFVMPRQIYESWLWKDTNALRAEAQGMRTYLLDHTRENRVMLLLNGAERLIYLMAKKCESQKKAAVYILPVNRQELADQSGFSVKTVNRSMKKLEEDGFLTREGHKVRITHSQYTAMKEYLDLISQCR